LNAEDLLRKANTALSSAKLLLQSDDADAACNRAYYTMFDAARASLISYVIQAPRELACA
jgi:uncharacterized protein (UPF0332 family)